MTKAAKIVSIVVAALFAVIALLAVATQIGAFVLERKYPPVGRFVDVPGARLHVVEIGPRDAAGLPIVMIHGASSSFETMRQPVGDRLAATHRVILIDRPGSGWSSRDRLSDTSPEIQARAISAALDQLGVSKAIIVVHSLAGALGARLALDDPNRVAGLVMLAPVAYPWPGGVGSYNDIVTTSVVGPLLAYTVTLPLGLLLLEPGVRAVFAPQTPPPHYVEDTAVPLVLRPRTFLANAWDLVTLKAAVAAQAPRYPQIRAATVVIAGDADDIVSTRIHSRPFAAAVPGAKLIVLPGVGHMVQNAAPDLVFGEIEAMAARLSPAKAAMQ